MPNPRRPGLAMELLRRYMAVAGLEQQARQGQSLTGRSEAYCLQALQDRRERSRCRHGSQYKANHGENKGCQSAD